MLWFLRELKNRTCQIIKKMSKVKEGYLVGGLLIAFVLLSLGITGVTSLVQTLNRGSEPSKSVEVGGKGVLWDQLGILDDLDHSFSFEISEECKQFMVEHDNLFPAKDLKSVIPYIDYDLSYRKIESKVDTIYGDKIMYLEQATISNIVEGRGVEIQVEDLEGNCYYIFYQRKLKGIHKGDVVDVYGVPLGMGAITQMEGENIPALIEVGCWIQHTFASDQLIQ